MLRTLPLCACAVLALSACSQSDTSENAAPAQSGEASDAAGDKTLAASLDQNSQFFQAAKAVGLDATLAGPGPYTVLVPSDQAFAAAEGDTLKNASDPQNREQVTRILAYHILPGVMLTDDISKAIDNSGGKAVLATMGGETLTATKEGGNIVLTGDNGTKATVTQADVKATNGVVHHIDSVLMPPAPGGGSEEEAGQQGQ